MTEEVIDRQIVEIVGDVSGLISAYTEAKSQAKGFEASLATIGSSLTSFGSKASLAITAPIALAATAAVSTATTFDDSMRKVQAVTGATGEQFETLRQLALDLGADTAFSASEAAEAMQYLGMAGLDTNEILEATPQMLSLASAGAMDLGTAADIATNVLSGFNLQVSDLAHVSDVLASAAASSNTSVEQLGTAMAYVGPVASSAGFSIEQTTAAIEIMSNAGIQGTMAGTALRGIISSLLTPTVEATKALAAYGLTAADVNPEMHSLAEIVEVLGDAGLSTADAMTIFGDRAGPGMIALLSSGSDALTDYSDALENCDGAAEAMAETMEGGAGGRIREFEGAIETLSITFGDLITDALMPAIDTIQGLAEWLSGLDEGTQKAIVTTGIFAAAIGPATLALGTMAGGVSNLITLYRTYQASTIASTIATKGLTAAIASNPIGLAIIGVTTLGAVLLSLSSSTDEATAAQKEYNDAIGTGVKLTDLSDEALQQKIVDLEESIRLNREAAAVLRGESTPATEEATDAIVAAGNATADLTDATNDQVSEFRAAVKAMNSNSGALNVMKQAEKDAAAATLEQTAAQQEQEAETLRQERYLRSLAAGAEEAYSRASDAVKEHQAKVSELQGEYDALKQTIDDALSIDQDVTESDRDVERADIRVREARADLDDLNEQIAEKEREMQTTEYESIDDREEDEKELAALKLRQRSATLDLADAEDAYTESLQAQQETQEKKTEIEKELNGESIESAQTRLDELSQKIQDETEEYQNALTAREKAQEAHETLTNEINNASLDTQSENWKAYVEWVAANPAIAMTYHVSYDENGNVIGDLPDVQEPAITVPKYADFSTDEGSGASALAETVANGTAAATAGGSAEETEATAAEASAAEGISIGTLNVYSPASDAATMAYETKRALRTLVSKGVGI